MYNRLSLPYFLFLHRFLFLRLFVYSLRFSFFYTLVAPPHVRYTCCTFINNSDRAREKINSFPPSFSLCYLLLSLSPLFFPAGMLVFLVPFRCTTLGLFIHHTFLPHLSLSTPQLFETFLFFSHTISHNL